MPTRKHTPTGYTAQQLSAAWSALRPHAQLKPERTHPVAGALRGSCPVHPDGDDSAVLFVGDDGNVAGRCWSRGCQLTAIREALGMPWIGERRIVDVQRYTYRRADGSTKVDVRTDYSDGSKDFKSRGPARGVLVDVFEADASDAPVVLVEGRKSALALIEAVGGAFAVAHGPGGAGSLAVLDFAPLQDRHVILWPDADAPAERGKRQVKSPEGFGAASPAIEALAASVRIVNLDRIEALGVPDKWDAADCPPALAAELLEPSALLGVPRVPRVPLANYAGSNIVSRSVSGSGGLLSRYDSSRSTALNARGAHGEHGEQQPDEPRHIEAHVAGYLGGLQGLGVEFRQDYRSGDMHARGELLDELEPDTPALVDGWRPLTDPLMQALASTANARYVTGRGRRIGEGLDRFRAAMRLQAASSKGDVFADWLKHLPAWDGTPRVAGLFVEALDAEDTELTRAAARVLLVGAIARTAWPGCKHDIVPVLAGSQGGGKSSLVRALLPPSMQALYFVDNVRLDQSTKQIGEQIGPALFVEFSELAGLPRAELGLLKSFLSAESDRYRAAYDQTATLRPRMWAAVGTVNPSPTEPGFLPPDPTGNRRFIAVPVGAPGRAHVVAWAEANRLQLWAEALQLYSTGAAWWLSPAEEAMQEQVNRGYVASAGRIEDALDQFLSWYEGDSGPEYGVPVLMVDVLREGGLLREGEAPGDADERAMGAALVLRGWTKRRSRGLDGNRKRWHPPQRGLFAGAGPPDPSADVAGRGAEAVEVWRPTPQPGLLGPPCPRCGHPSYDANTPHLVKREDGELINCE